MVTVVMIMLCNGVLCVEAIIACLLIMFV